MGVSSQKKLLNTNRNTASMDLHIDTPIDVRVLACAGQPLTDTILDGFAHAKP